jgi:hypothetical protein
MKVCLKKLPKRGISIYSHPSYTTLNCDEKKVALQTMIQLHLLLVPMKVCQKKFPKRSISIYSHPPYTARNFDEKKVALHTMIQLHLLLVPMKVCQRNSLKEVFRSTVTLHIPPQTSAKKLALFRSLTLC